MNNNGQYLRINEIFKSIQGESTYAGIPCIFIRLAGCNLRCSYCDTTYAYGEGSDMSLADITHRVHEYDCKNVCITGGEPLLQKNVNTLIKLLKKNQINVYIETNGSMDIAKLPKGIVRIVDIKCPGSKMVRKTDWKNIKNLTGKDEVKFIISSKSDYEWARNITNKYKLTNKVTVLFGLVHGSLKPKTLAGWILKDGIDVRLHLQLHRIIWPNKARGV